MDRRLEIFDKVQRLYGVRGFNDHELHCLLRFERPLDLDLLKRSMFASIKAIPVLGSSYVDGDGSGWSSLAPGDVEEAFSIATTEAELEAFFVSRDDESLGPQVRACVLQANSFTVAFKMNHMISDAAGFKQFLNFLGDTYTQLSRDGDYRPPQIDADRSPRAVLDRFDLSSKLKALLLHNNDNNRSGIHRFPLSEGEKAQPFILTRKLGRSRLASLTSYGRERRATLNDVVLTAFYRCMFRKLALSAGEELEIPLMVDMRRYLGDAREFRSLTNLTSMVSTRLDFRPDESFEDALGRISAIMLEKKRADIGLNGFVKLDFLYRIFGERVADRMLRSRLSNPLICMTNVGILNPAQISFGGLQPIDAYLCGSIKYKPYFQLAMSSYNGELTLTVNQCGSAADREQILAFLSDVDAELPGTDVAIPPRTRPADSLAHTIMP